MGNNFSTSKNFLSKEDKIYIKAMRDKYPLLSEEDELNIISKYNIIKIKLYQALLKNNIAKSLFIEMLQNILTVKSKRKQEKTTQMFSQADCKKWLENISNNVVDLDEKLLRIRPALTVSNKVQDPEISGIVIEIQELQQQMIGSNFLLILKNAQKYHNALFSQFDLLHYGIEGVIDALDKYDANHRFEKSNKFSTMAVPWIKHHISRNLKNKKDLVRYPIHVSENYAKIKIYIEEARINGVPVNEEEMRKSLKFTEKAFREAMDSNMQYASIDSFDSEHTKLENRIEADSDSYRKDYDNRMNNENMENFFKEIIEKSKKEKMPIDDKDIVLLKHHQEFNQDPMKIEDLATLLKCSKESIRKWTDDLKKKLQQPTVRALAMELLQ